MDDNLFAEPQFSQPPEAKNPSRSEVASFVLNLKIGVWILGIASWLFGITDRSIATFSDGYLSAVDITQLLTASFFFASWLFLKPSPTLTTRSAGD